MHSLDNPSLDSGILTLLSLSLNLVSGTQMPLLALASPDSPSLANGTLTLLSFSHNLASGTLMP